MKYPPITYALLQEKDACKDHLDLFEQHIGRNEPIPLTDDTIQKFGDVFDVSWAAEWLLDSHDFSEFYYETAPAYNDYNNKCILAWNECKKVRNLGLGEFSKFGGITLAEYDKLRQAAEIKYEKTRRANWSEFEKAKAIVFVRIYKRGLTS